MVPKRNIVAYSVLLFLLSPPAFSKKLFNLGGGNGNASPSASPIAQEDFATLVADNIPAVPVTGNVMTNDSNGAFATLTSSPASKYGTIIFNEPSFLLENNKQLYFYGANDDILKHLVYTT